MITHDYCYVNNDEGSVQQQENRIRIYINKIKDNIFKIMIIIC